MDLSSVRQWTGRRRPQWSNPLPSSTSSSPAAARPDWRLGPRSSRRRGKAHPSRSSIRGRRLGQALATCARSRSPRGRGACSGISAPGRRSSRKCNRSCRWRSWTGRCATRCAYPISTSTRKTARRSPIWRSTTMSSARSRRSAIGSGFNASPGPLRVGLRASASASLGYPTGVWCARASRSPPTARARNSASSRTFRPSAGTMTRRALSRRSRTSAITRVVPSTGNSV